jgi:hypothetical protein
MGELSPKDIEVTAAFAARLPRGKRVLLRAVVPTGFTWETEFSTGHR